MTVVDASVVVALMNPEEPNHHACRSWLGETVLAGQEIIAPVTILAEVGATLSRGQPDHLLARRAIELLARESLIHLKPVVLELSRLAAGLAVKHHLRGCDAIYLALAQQQETNLVTLDKKQQASGGETVRTPF